MTLTEHAKERIRSRRIPREMVDACFHGGGKYMGQGETPGTHLFELGKMVMVRQDDVVVTVYWKYEGI